MTPRENRLRQQAATHEAQVIVPDFARLAHQLKQAVNPDRLAVFAGHLGVTPESLTRLGIGRDDQAGCWCFPERDAEGQIIGIATRDDEDKKRCLKGSQRGLTLAWPLGAYDGTSGDDPVLILEGASDTAAAMDLGFTAIGRPSATGGLDYLKVILKGRHVAIIGENDTGAGHTGAEKIAQGLHGIAASVKTVYPPECAKDLRQWKNAPAGCDRDEVLAAIRHAEAFVPSDEPEPHREPRDTPNRRRSHADALVELADEARLFQAPGQEGGAYAVISVDDHEENWPIKSERFRDWLSRRYWETQDKVPSSQAKQDALGVIVSKALYEGPALPVAVRLAQHDGDIYLDLADEQWRAVRISAQGWELTCEPPVRFIRKWGMLPLPMPESGGRVDELRELVNVPDDDAWVLFVAWLVAALRPDRPFPILCVNGEQGSAKSSLCKMARALIDPNQAPLRRPSNRDRDLMITANNGWIVGFDNISGVAPSLSDTLCSLSTGGGFATRELYSDDGEKLFAAMRPVMLNGISDVATRSDLLDRAIQLTLPTIAEDKRRDEDDLWRRFEQIRPRVIGALLDAVVTALKNLDSVRLDRKPRMADFAKWVVAAEPALGWDPGRFIEAYSKNRSESHVHAIEGSPVGLAIREWMAGQKDWEGTSTELLTVLEKGCVDDKTPKKKDWPKSPRSLSNTIRRLAPNLRALGVNVTFDREHGGNRRRLVRLENKGNPPSQSSLPSQYESDEPETEIPLGRLWDGIDGAGVAYRPKKTGDTGPKTAIRDGRDDRDGEIPTQSGPPRKRVVI